MMSENNGIQQLADDNNIQSTGIVDNYKRMILILLWTGTLVLIVIMITQWKNADNPKSTRKDLFVDEMLLSSEDMGLGKNTSLINLKLKTIIRNENNIQTLSLPDNRKKVYNKILEQKVNTVTENSNDDGFYIKPTPK